jgi:Na+/H+ antiporter NhaC
LVASSETRPEQEATCSPRWTSGSRRSPPPAAVTAFGLNVIVGDRYVAVILPARLFREEFERRGLPATSLSHTIADAGTVTSPLVTWNSCGAYMAAVLGIPPRPARTSSSWIIGFPS